MDFEKICACCSGENRDPTTWICEKCVKIALRLGKPLHKSYNFEQARKSSLQQIELEKE